MHFYLHGPATAADVLRELTKPDNTGIKKKAKDELRKKLGDSTDRSASWANDQDTGQVGEEK
jgi:hypothetical protein